MKYGMLLTAILITICGQNSFSQSLAVNTSGAAAHASAMLDVSSTSKGMLIPRMTTANRTGIVAPATGLLIYDTDLNQFYYWNGTVWIGVANNSNYWTLSGNNLYNNAGTQVGIGTTSSGETAADLLGVNGNIRMIGNDTVYVAQSTTGSGKSLTLRAGYAYVPVGGSGGNVNILATNNMPSGGSGYSNLGPSGNINLTAGSGYNSAGGNINITAGATSCWALTANSHADVNIQGGADLASADAASINIQGGGTVGVGCPTANANGGNLVLKSGIGTGSGTQGNIQLLNGKVGIGCTTPAYTLHVIGDIASSATVRSTNAVVTGAISACSDGRFKTNITALAAPLQKLMMLNGLNYFWKTSEFPDMHFSEKKQMGFIAQDVEKIFPEVVFTDDNGYKSIDYSRLTPVLVETIKAQQKQINELSKRLDEVEKKVNK